MAEQDKAAGRIRIGVGGWTFPPWRGRFYPEGLAQAKELAYAAGQLTAIEINGTYYGSQKPESFQRWHDETPDDFIFTLKGPRFTTNRRVLADAGPSIERFVTSGITRLGAKLGPINWQFMPTKGFEPEDFAAFLSLLPRDCDGIALRHAVEVRHASFACADFVALARRHGVAVITAGDSPYPQIADPTAPFAYLRLMGTTEAAGGYDAAAIARWAAHARDLAQGGVPEDLACAGAPQPPGPPRDVFLFVIGGFKEANPAMARALIAACA